MDGTGGKHRRGDDVDVICDLIGRPPSYIDPGGREDHLDTG